MSHLHTLRLCIGARLAAAVEEIWDLVEITITEEVSSLKQEIERLHKAAAEPQPSLAVPAPPPREQENELEMFSRPVKEELMEFPVGSCHEGSPLSEEEEADLNDFIFSPTCVTSGHDQDQPRSPNLQLRAQDREETGELRPKAAQVSQTSAAVNQDDPDAQRSNAESSGPAVGKTHGPQLGQAAQQVVILRAEPVSTPVSRAGQSPQDAQGRDPQGRDPQGRDPQGRDPVQLTVEQLDQLTQGAQKLMVQGKGGQTTGQLQVIPQGVTVTRGDRQEVMLATLPDGQVQRFLFTPMLPAATSSTGQAGKEAVTQIKLTLTQLASSAPDRSLSPKSPEAPSASLCDSQKAKRKQDTVLLQTPKEKKYKRCWGKLHKRTWIEQVNQTYPYALRFNRGSAAWRMRGPQLGMKVARSNEMQPVNRQPEGITLSLDADGILCVNSD